MKKKVALPIIIALAVVASYSLIYIGYTALRERNDLVQRKAIYNGAVEFIKIDPYFAEEYGEVSEVVPADKYRVIFKKDNNSNSFVLNCAVTLKDGSKYDVILEYTPVRYLYKSIEIKN